MSDPSEPAEPGSTPQLPPRGPRLESWKEIAAHLGRDVRTVQRWERGEGLPVHRHQHDRLGSVYAFQDQIDAWRNARSIGPEAPSANSTVEREATSVVGDTIPRDAVPPAGPLPEPRVRQGTKLVVAVVIAVVALGATWLTMRRMATPAETARPAIASIVVLPFDNLSSDPDQEFFAAGLTEEITGRLAQLTRLRVVSRTSAMSLRERKLSVPALAQELDVDAVIEGSVRREAGRVRISVQLIHAPTDRHLWARDFEGEADAAWPLQIEVASAVADELRVPATAEERARLTAAPRVTSAAHEEYLLGRYLRSKLVDADRVRAMEHFTRAIELQPDYAAPYGALANAWWMRGVFGPLSFREVAGPAREAALAGLARDDGNVEARAALAYVQGIVDWDWSRAEATIQRALALEPNNVDARYVHSVLLMALGRLDAAVAEIELAARLDPLSPQVHSTFGRVLYRARRFDEARRRLERAVELEPRSTTTSGRLVAVLEQLGHHDDALALVDGIDARSEGTPMLVAGWRARILARSGQTTAARQLLTTMPADSLQRTEILAALGDRDAAFASLFRALDGRESWLPFIKSDPIFDGLRADSRWTAVLRRMNLE